jgi:hypothetical protein
MEATPKIHQAISHIMSAIGGVGKTRVNKQQSYNYRGIADIYLACQPLMAQFGVHVIPHQVLSHDITTHESHKGGALFRVAMRVQFRAYAEDGSFVQGETVGEAMDSGDKATNKAMSSAMKYFLVQLFALPEQDPTLDTESDSPEVRPRGAQEPKTPAPKPEPTPLLATPAEIEDLGRRVAALPEHATLMADGAPSDILREWRKAWVAKTVGHPVDLAKLTKDDLGKALAAMVIS